MLLLSLVHKRITLTKIITSQITKFACMLMTIGFDSFNKFNWFIQIFNKQQLQRKMYSITYKCRPQLLSLVEDKNLSSLLSTKDVNIQLLDEIKLKK